MAESPGQTIALEAISQVFFTIYIQLAEMAKLASTDSGTPKKKLPPVGLNLMQGVITGL